LFILGKEELDGTIELCLAYSDALIGDHARSFALCAAVGYLSNAIQAQSKSVSKLIPKILQSLSKSVLLDDYLARALVRWLSTAPLNIVDLVSRSILPNLQYMTENDKLKVTQVYYTMSKSRLTKLPRTFLSCIRGLVSEQLLDQYCDVMLEATKDGSFSSSFALLGIVKSLQEFLDRDTRLSRRSHFVMKKKLLLQLLAEANEDSLLLLGELLQIDSTLVDIADEGLVRKFLEKTPTILHQKYLSYEAYMQDSIETIYFSSNGQVSRATSHLLARIMMQQDYAFISQFFGFLSRMFVDFQDHCDSEFCLSPHSNPTNPQQARMWKFLKTVLFSYLLITESFCKGLVPCMRTPISRENVLHIKSSIFSVLYSLQSMHFVTVRFGLGGLPLFESQIAVICAFAVRYGFVQSFIEKYKIPPSGIQELDIRSSMIHHSGLSFFLQLIKNTIYFIEDQVLEHDVEPLLWKNFLVKVSNQGAPLESLKLDVRDLSHVACLQLFSLSYLQKNAIRRLTLPYVQVLIENLDKGIDLDLVREAFKSVMKGLSDFSPSVTEKFLSARFKISSDTDVAQSSIDIRTSELVPQFNDIDQKEWIEEAAELAWECVQALVLYIYDPPPRESTLPVLKDVNLSKPFSQISLLLILFEQIPVIAFSKLEELLQLVSDLMLHGFHDEGFGVVRSRELSPLWNALFDAISDPNRVDYSRRYDCVVWYLDLYDKASKLNPLSHVQNSTSTRPTTPIKARL
jgi:hypothetical protein